MNLNTVVGGSKKISGIFDSLNSLKISVRIGILAALGILSILVLGSTYVVGEMNTVSASESQWDHAQLAQLEKSVEIWTLQMRRNEKDFLLRKDMKYVERYENSVSEVLAALEAMKGLQASRALREEITLISEGVAAHAEQFRRVVELTEQLGMDEKQGVQGVLRSAVHVVETKLKEANMPELTVKMLMMRRHEKDFMLRGAEKYIGRINERRAEFDSILQSSELPLSFQNDISRLLDNYQAGIRTYADVYMMLQAETKKLSSIFADMVPAFERTSIVASEGLTESEHYLEEARALTELIFLIVSVSVLAAVGVFAFAVGSSITGSMKRITGTMSVLAKGETNLEIPFLDAKNEIGEIAQAVEVFRENALERARLEAEQSERQAAQEKRAAQVEEMIASFDGKVADLLDSVSLASTQLHNTAGSMTQTAETTGASASAASSAAESASSNVQAVASAAEELHAAIGEVGRQVNQSTDISRKTSDAAGQTSETMKELAEAADKIGAVISLIQDIAEQTNLLALNATIEAARAGEAGKGFAVVAGEVKSLANQTAKATDEISLQISTMQSSTQSAVNAIDGVNGMISQMSEIATAISSAVEQQGAATQEIAGSVQEAARGTSEVTTNITEVDSAAAESTQTAKKVTQFASDLSEKSDVLRKEVEVFLQNVKAA